MVGLTLLVAPLLQIDRNHGLMKHFERHFMNTTTLFFVDDTNIIMVSMPIQEDHAIFDYSFSRRSEHQVVKLTKIGKKQTRFAATTHLALGATISNEALRSILKKKNANLCQGTQQYFLQDIPLEIMSSEIGHQLGNLLLLGTPSGVGFEGKSSLQNRVKWMFRTFDSMRKVKEKYAWFDELMEEMLKNNPTRHFIVNQAVPTQSLSSKNARRIGQSLSLSLAASITTKAGSRSVSSSIRACRS